MINKTIIENKKRSICIYLAIIYIYILMFLKILFQTKLELLKQINMDKVQHINEYLLFTYRTSKRNFYLE